MSIGPYLLLKVEEGLLAYQSSHGIGASRYVSCVEMLCGRLEEVLEVHTCQFVGISRTNERTGQRKRRRTFREQQSHSSQNHQLADIPKLASRSLIMIIQTYLMVDG